VNILIAGDFRPKRGEGSTGEERLREKKGRGAEMVSGTRASPPAYEKNRAL